MLVELKEATSLRDKIAFRIIRLGFKIAMKNSREKSFFQYSLLGDKYTYQNFLHSLTKTVEQEEGGEE